MDKLSLNSIKIDSPIDFTTEDVVRVEGYAAHFDKVNLNGEIVTKESFDTFLRTLSEGGMMPMFTYNHDCNAIIGGWDTIRTDDTGLWCEGHLNKNVKFVSDTIIPLMQSGDLNYLSTEGFTPWDKVEETEEGFLLKDFCLTAISLVALPADFSAKVNIKNRLETLHSNDVEKVGNRRGVRLI